MAGFKPAEYATGKEPESCAQARWIFELYTNLGADLVYEYSVF